MSTSRLSSAVTWFALLAGAAYLFLRFSRESLEPALYCVVYYGLTTVLIWRVLLPCKGNLEKLMLGLLGIACAYPLLNAASLHAWADLYVHVADEDDTEVYRAWLRDGASELRTDVSTSKVHANGDELAHLAYAQAIATHGPWPSRLEGLVKDIRGHNRAYWIHRGSQGHPPGLAILFSSVATNPPIARALDFCIYLLCVAAADGAGQQLQPGADFGAFCMAMFLGVTNVLWWHSFRVSADMLPTLPAFIGTGLLWRGLSATPTVSRATLLAAGLCFGISCLVTHTGVLAVAAAAPLLFTVPSSGELRARASLLLLPGVIATVAGIAFSCAIVGVDDHVILGRFSSAAQAEQFDRRGMNWLWLLRRLPSDLGPPLCVFWVFSLLRTCWVFSRHPCRLRALRLASAAAVVVPASCMFWAQVRYMLPGWAFICVGVGAFDFWESGSNRMRSLSVATLIAFSFSKFAFSCFELY